MSETNTTATVLNAMDIKALRQADRVCFYSQGREGTVTAIKELKKTGPFDDRDRRHEFSCGAVFDGVFSWEVANLLSAYEMVYRFNEQWQTICHFLKAGDELILRWCPDAGRNGYLERARCDGEKLHADRLYLRVRRGKKTFSFLLATQLCPDNTARMVKGMPRREA